MLDVDSTSSDSDTAYLTPLTELRKTELDEKQKSKDTQSKSKKKLKKHEKSKKKKKA